MLNYKYDVFIAYHGTYSSGGSYETAKEIAEYLKKVRGEDKVYIFNSQDGEPWDKTPLFLSESRTLIVVVNNNVLIDNNGHIASKRTSENSLQPYQLYVEISTFRQQVNAADRSAQTLNFIYCGEDKTDNGARMFCSNLVPGIEVLNNVFGKNYKSPDGSYEIVNEWIDSAISIQKTFDFNKCQMEEENYRVVQNEETVINDIFAEIEEEMFEENCTAVFGPTLNENCMNFKYGEGNTYFEKCHHLFNKGRNKLDSALRENFSANKIYANTQRLVKFPFSTIITTDEYSNIDLALKSSSKEFMVIRDEDDVFSLDVQHGEIPVFMLERSAAWADDCIIQSNEISVILKMLLIGRKIIYVGYNEDYDGYIRVANALRKLLGDDFFTCSNNIAIVKSDKPYKVYFDDKNRCTILNLTVEEFIKKLESSNELFKKIMNMNDENDEFVVDLFKIASTPTETQAIKLLLEQLSNDINSGMSLEEIINKYDKSVKCLKTIKPNFNAFEKCWLNLREKLISGEIRHPAEMKLIVDRVCIARSEISLGIRNQASKVFNKGKGKNILLFSQSLRVIEFLCGTDEEFQKDSHLWICECRPKSDTPFRDAMNTHELLQEYGANFANVTIIPDMAAFNLINRKLIDVVVIGAHDIVLKDNEPISFINTCGSIALLELAEKNKIDFYVVAESGKFTEAVNNNGILEYEISYGHESTIYSDLKFVSWAKKVKVNTKNIGYDFCYFFDGMKLIYEKGVINCSKPDIEIKLIDKTRGN